MPRPPRLVAMWKARRDELASATVVDNDLIGETAGQCIWTIATSPHTDKEIARSSSMTHCPPTTTLHAVESL
jgi:hypothetical protein